MSRPWSAERRLLGARPFFSRSPIYHVVGICVLPFLEARILDPVYILPGTIIRAHVNRVAAAQPVSSGLLALYVRTYGCRYYGPGFGAATL